MSNVDGLVEDGWEQVADTFRANFKEGKTAMWELAERA
jgi:hypothetical protein